MLILPRKISLVVYSLFVIFGLFVPLDHLGIWLTCTIGFISADALELISREIQS